MKLTNLVAVNNIITDSSVLELIYENKNTELQFSNAFVDFLNRTIVLQSDNGFLRSPVIKDTYIKDDAQIFYFQSYEEGWFSIKYIKQNT